MTPNPQRIGALALAAAALAVAPSVAHARVPLQSCGNAKAKGGLLIDDIITRRVTCHQARRVARKVPGKCGLHTGSCRVEGFSCLSAQAGEELRFVRCIKPHGNDELHRLIRFDFGS
jgi:hypothetical protein